MTDDLDLDIQVCEACHSGSPVLSDDEVRRLHAQIPDWHIIEVDGVLRLSRTFRLKGWKAPVAFVAELALVADENDHHPRITLDWGQVQVEWWTHAIKGLHRNDFIMAAKTDKIASS
ncbi:MAG: 4a-hydroxytetrahydrobiopterin dehydratase [Thermomicrobiales bacterium]|nr:4a-hydroxytetrahydrobiopterin dehydratase [Thermomicrobiales bacterium]MCO5217898.1 4a-hydroxytetrahydrobiopterin dehydratase [Thermomicrobiales bacterium]MCO5224181.1 4a-hydroxytetrahydrobiopterin dehydratase [Thermomicrobiales bacterium]MCO5227137.1 4a-hydroxytetrahydrobiopterin dehydratase [Thermomicrobiales bacterium]